MKTRKPKRSAAEFVAIGVGVAAAIALPAWLIGGSYIQQRAANVSLAHEWSIDGHPCPSLTAAQFQAQGLKAPKGTKFEDATFFRQFGHMGCGQVHFDGGTGLGAYSVCKFTAPNVLRVQTDKGEWFYAPGIGQAAAIATPHGEAHCVLIAHFVP